MQQDYKSEILNAIKSDVSDAELREKLNQYHENDIADALAILDVSERKRLYHIIGVDDVAEIFTYLDDVEDYIQELDVETAADILESMDSDEAVDVLDELDDPVKEKLINLMDEESQKDINLIQSYDEDEIGSRMTTNFIEIEKDISVKEAMREMVTQAEENDNIMTLYVTDKWGEFYGAMELPDLIRAREYTKLDSLVSTSYPTVHAHEKVSECIERIRDYEEDSIPILDNANRLIGVITAQDIIDVVDAEMGDDYAKLAGLIAEEDLEETLPESMKKRMPWLIILMFLGMVVSSVVGLFEPVVSQIALIVCFQSLILDMAGNVGTQSLAVTIRVLMDENLKASQKVQLVFKEMRVGFANGLVLGVMAVLFIGGYVLLFKHKSMIYAFAVSGCVGVSLMTAMVISSLVGTVVPMFFHKINIDPAVASGPLITTVNDLVAVVTYYGLSWILLINVLHMV